MRYMSGRGKKAVVCVAIVAVSLAAGDCVYACTGFCIARDDVVLVGNNEDWKNPNTKVWFEPAEEGKYGRVYFGFDNFSPQGGMNEKGLVFDGFATAPKAVKTSLDKPVYEGNLLDKFMAECATVDEVLELLEKFNLKFMEPAMYFIADARGDSAIIEGDEVIRKDGRYQVVTNFYQSEAKGGDISCERYKIACQMLGDADGISVDLCKRVLAATHNEGVTPTLYSNVYDAGNRVVYLYHFHDFLHEVRIDLKEELTKGRHSMDLPGLFPRNFSAERFAMARAREAKIERMGAVRSVSPGVLERYVGRYRITKGEHKGMVISITCRGSLFAQAEGQDMIDLHAVSDEEFFYVDPSTELKVEFVSTLMGKVTKLRIDQEGQTHTAERIK